MVARDAKLAGPPFGVSAEALTAQSCLRRSPHLFAGRALRVRGEEKTCEPSRRQTRLTFLINHLPGHRTEMEKHMFGARRVWICYPSQEAFGMISRLPDGSSYPVRAHIVRFSAPLS